MKRIALKLVLTLGVVLAVCGCAGKEKNEMVGVDGYSEHIIEFPSGNDEETEYDQEALTIDTFTLEVALPDVYYSPVITGGSEEKKNKGIVSYDLTHDVYVAIELEDDALSDDAYSYIANSLSLACSFNGENGRKDQTEAYAVTQYGNVKVTVYQEESDWSDPYIYRAEFIVDGVACNLSIHSDDPEEIDDYLNVLLGEPVDGNTHILSDVLGFDVCRVEMEETSPHQVMWHYYVEVNGEDICVAEQFGYENYPESWSRDLDGDGVPELICNDQYGDGVQVVCVYRNNNGSIEEGSIRWSYYSEKFGWTNIGEDGISRQPAERYDPERGIFTATGYYENDSDTSVTVEFDDGLIPFEFLPFKHLP